MTTTRLPPLAFIGGGNMSKALIGGLYAHEATSPPIWVADPNTGQRDQLRATYPQVQVTADNLVAAQNAGVWILAVKPQYIKAVALALAPLATTRRPLVVSVAAGIRAVDLQRWLGTAATIVRSMPNRPALVGAGITALFAHGAVDPERRATAQALMAAVGRVVWVESDSDIDAVTAVSGSGPAYFLRLIELMTEAGAKLGLSSEVAQTLAIETALGTAKLAQESGRPPAELRAEVTSAGGTTAAAIAVMEAADLRGIVERAVTAAKQRAGELAAQFGAD